LEAKRQKVRQRGEKFFQWGKSESLTSPISLNKKQGLLFRGEDGTQKKRKGRYNFGVQWKILTKQKKNLA